MVTEGYYGYYTSCRRNTYSYSVSFAVVTIVICYKISKVLNTFSLYPISLPPAALRRMSHDRVPRLSLTISPTSASDLLISEVFGGKYGNLKSDQIGQNYYEAGRRIKASL